MNVILLGPPGAGKGTQAQRLVEEFDLRYLASGDLLRSERARGTELGRRVAEYMDAGHLVPDSIITEVILARLRGTDGPAGLLLDGFPRTVGQAESLAKALAETERRVDVVVSLEVADEVLIRRISGRRVCPACGAVYQELTDPPRQAGRCDKDGAELVQRPDDQESVVAQRLEAYHRQTKPLIAYYHRKSLLCPVNGDADPEEVAQSLRRLLVKHRRAS